MKVSVVVPVYNVQDYLKKCVESIINQSHRDLEIILVDDGSTDISGQMCDDFAKHDSRIKVIHKINGGLSDARNKGIALATSEWITFIDSDDYVTTDYIEYLLNLVLENNSDISIATFKYVTRNKQIDKATGEISKMSKDDALERMLLNDGFDMGAWAKLYRTEYFNDIKYPVGKLYEDSGTTYKLIDKASSVVFGSKSIYFYINRSDSIVNSSFNPKKLDLIEMNQEMYIFIRKKYSHLTYAAERRLLWAYFSTLNQIIATKDKIIIDKYGKNIVKYIKMQGKTIKGNKSLPKRDKWAFYLLNNGGLSIYTICWNIYLKIIK